jgi:hypothetical protein
MKPASDPPTVKGSVERAIRYLNGSFFAARQSSDLDDLNRQVGVAGGDASAKGAARVVAGALNCSATRDDLAMRRHYAETYRLRSPA